VRGTAGAAEAGEELAAAFAGRGDSAVAARSVADTVLAVLRSADVIVRKPR